MLRETCKIFNKLSGKTDWGVWVHVCKVGAGSGNEAACTGLSSCPPPAPTSPWRTAARAAEGRSISLWTGFLVWRLAKFTRRTTSGCSTARLGRQHLPGRAWLPDMCWFGGSGMEKTRSNFAWFLQACLRIRWRWSRGQVSSDPKDGRARGG